MASYCENKIFILNKENTKRFERFNIAPDMFQDEEASEGNSCVLFSKPSGHWNGSPEADDPVLYISVNAIFYFDVLQGTRRLRPNVSKMLGITCTIYPLRLVSWKPVQPSLLKELRDNNILVTEVASVPKYSAENANSIIILDTNPPRLNTQDTEMYTHKLFVPEYSAIVPQLNLQVHNTLTWLCSNFTNLRNKKVVAVDSSVQFGNIKTSNVVVDKRMTIFFAIPRLLFKKVEGTKIITVRRKAEDFVARLCRIGLCKFIVPHKYLDKMDPDICTLYPNAFISENEFVSKVWNRTFWKFDISHIVSGSAVLIGDDINTFVQERYSFLASDDERLAEVLKLVEDLAKKYAERCNVILATKARLPEQNELIQFGVKNYKTLMYYKQLPKIVTKNPWPVIFLDIDNTLVEAEYDEKGGLTVHLRPWVREFFEQLKDHVYFAFFTAASEAHARAVVAWLNSKIKDSIALEVFYNEDMCSGKKDIGNRGMDTKWCFLVDDKPENGVYAEQTIRVPPFTYNHENPNPTDSTFSDLIPQFRKVAEGFEAQKMMHKVEHYAFV